MTRPLIHLGLQLTLAAIRLNAAAAKASRSTADYQEWLASIRNRDRLRKQFRKQLANETGLSACVIEGLLKHDGPIVLSPMDTDQNAGQRRCAAIAEAKGAESI